MRGVRSGAIGLVVPTIDNAIFDEVNQAFYEAAGEQDFTILLSSHGYDLEKNTRSGANSLNTGSDVWFRSASIIRT